MSVLLKMHVSGKIFHKICIKVVRVPFFPNIWSVIRGQGSQFFDGGDIQQMGEVQNF